MGCINSTKAVRTEANSGVKRAVIKTGAGSKQQGVHELKQNYFIDSKTKVLGVGAFGRVFHTTNKHNPDFQVAIKVLDKIKLRENIDCIMEEVAILHSLDHPNIVRYLGCQVSRRTPLLAEGARRRSQCPPLLWPRARSPRSGPVPPTAPFC